eukprot:TRINITY_DN840_c0_g1_i1.p1 TRINITY_DN840_c0_g1~~TRINITY_DN840_c0_g1_i1.p1  ORF type:complete len:238 (-),score=25.51 TRINITY_DN840_c0_g1_i1:239-952(-)
MKFHSIPKRMPFFFTSISRIARTVGYATGANIRTFSTISQSDSNVKPLKSAFKSYNTEQLPTSKSESQILSNKSVSWSDGYVKEEPQFIPSQIPLVFRSVQFVHEKSSGGETLRGGVYYQGDKVIISHVIEGYCMAVMNDVCIRSISRVVDSHGEIFYSNSGTQTLHFENSSVYQKVLFPAMFFVQLPTSIPVGEYQIMLIVEDVYGKRATSFSIGFKIIPKSSFSVAKAILSLLFL